MLEDRVAPRRSHDPAALHILTGLRLRKRNTSMGNIRDEQFATTRPDSRFSKYSLIRIIAYVLSTVLLFLVGLEMFKTRQPSNEAYAWNRIGYCYLYGNGNISDVVALTWVKEIRDNKEIRGNEDILNDPLVQRHCKGVQLPQLAAKYFSKAAEQGLSDAQFNLARLYRDGTGVAHSSKKAMRLFQKAAKQGHAGAQFNLGIRYSKGRDIGQNDKKAVYWFEKAAKQGLVIAQYSLAMSYIEVDHDYEKGLEILRTLAVSDAASQNSIGQCYYHGYGVKQDYRIALHWFGKASKQRISIAEYNIGVMFFYGYGVKQNLTEAAGWMHRAAIKNEATAMRSVGDLYNEGWGVQKDTEVAMEWWRRAAYAGDIQAKEHLEQIDNKGR